MTQWEIPHNEPHRFLDWGPRDEIFKAWCDFFSAKGVKFEVGGGGDNWTIYKHLLHCNPLKPGMTRCCPSEEEL